MPEDALLMLMGAVLCAPAQLLYRISGKGVLNLLRQAGYKVEGIK